MIEIDSSCVLALGRSNTGPSLLRRPLRHHDEVRSMLFYGGVPENRIGPEARTGNAGVAVAPPPSLLNSDLSGPLVGCDSQENGAVSGPGNHGDRDHIQPGFDSIQPDSDWGLVGGYHAFLPADPASTWDPAGYTYSSEAIHSGERYDDFFELRPTGPEYDSAWAAGQGAARQVAEPGPSRRNSSGLSCAGSRCSSPCVYGDQCDLTGPCELGDECGLDLRCDASDCHDEPACADQCCPAYTCEETKAAATLASFGGDSHPPGPPQNSGKSTASHTHCDGNLGAPQAVIRHLVENHNDPLDESCVRPCLVDHPWNYSFCPMTCLIGHPQLHSQQYQLNSSHPHTSLDGNLRFQFSPVALADDCNVQWTSAEQLLEHWRMQHGALATAQHHHQLAPSFGSTQQSIHSPSLPNQEEHWIRAAGQLASSPILGNAPSAVTSASAHSSEVSSPPTTSGHRSNGSLTGEPLGYRPDPPPGAAERLVCRWWESPGAGRCGKVFSTPKELNQHVIGTHVKNLERTAEGYDCGWEGCKRRADGKKGFPQKSKMERHVQTHTGGLLPSCTTTCPSHDRPRSPCDTNTWLSRVSEKPYECPVCHMTFSAKQALDQHELIHKGSKPLPCGYPGCTKTFRQQSARTMHMRTHTKVKPLACNICGRRFSESSNLSKHRRTHSQIGAFECDYEGCNKTFHRLDQLRRHQKTHGEKAKSRRGRYLDIGIPEAAENLQNDCASDTSQSDP